MILEFEIEQSNFNPRFYYIKRKGLQIASLTFMVEDYKDLELKEMKIK